MFQTFPGVLAAVAHLSAGGIAAVLVDFDYTHNPTFQSDKQPQLTTKAVPFTPPIAIVLVVVVAALFACVTCCICIRHRRRSNVSVADLHTAATQKCGLGREDIDAFPAFYYSEVKDRKIGMGALECAVCLIEFEDADKLTLLPKCDHVFHTECIGDWLEHHITCPVCRSDLTEAATDEITKNDESGFRQGEIALQVDEIQMADGETVGKQKAFDMSKFRSHTTGHSLAVSGENFDRFTLKLPTGVRKEVMKRSSMNRTRSSVSGKSGFNGESDRRSASFNQWFRRSMKSDRQAIFTRTISMFSPKAETDGGGGSSDFRGGGRATRRTKSLKMLNRQDVNEL